jgi:hypothetical protein
MVYMALYPRRQELFIITGVGTSNPTVSHLQSFVLNTTGILQWGIRPFKASSYKRKTVCREFRSHDFSV